MIKVITGIRRCGKSFLLFRIFKKYLLKNGVDEDHVIEVALDGIENEELRNPKTCYQYVKTAVKDNESYYLLLDEIQFMPRFEEVLNSLLRIGNIDIYVTGSNSRFLSSDIVTEFRGRGDEVRIYPLSFAEFYSVYDGEYEDAWNDYMIYGGLPQVAGFQTERQKAEYLKNIFTNVYLKDVVERNGIQSIDGLSTLVDILASVIGALTNPTRISNTFASECQNSYTNKTISKHIDYLEEAFLISKSNRYDIKGRKYYEYGKDQEGKRVRRQLEVDFVINQGSQRYYVQVAYNMASKEKQAQEFHSLRNIPDSFKKIVIVDGTAKPWRNEEGFVIMGMRYFLLNSDSLEF